VSDGASPGYAAARDDAALERLVGADALDLVGEDRVRFLHNLTTADVKALSPGESARAFVTTVQGKIVASADVVALDDRLRLVLPSGSAAAAEAHLSRYRVVERVEIHAPADLVTARLRGARAARALLAAGLPAPESAGDHAETGDGETAVRIRRLALGREPRFELSGAHAALERALARLTGGDVAVVDLAGTDAELLRVEDGEPRFGTDYGEEAFPQETGDELAISYTKGCYLGQEVVARIHYRGGVQRAPRGLRFAGGPPAPATPLLVDGREVGRATSVAVSPRFGPIGLALVHRRAHEASARVELPDGGAVELAPLPFA